jgi:hypothetical protein
MLSEYEKEHTHPTTSRLCPPLKKKVQKKKDPRPSKTKITLGSFRAVCAALVNGIANFHFFLGGTEGAHVTVCATQGNASAYIAFLYCR